MSARRGNLIFALLIPGCSTFTVSAKPALFHQTHGNGWLRGGTAAAASAPSTEEVDLDARYAAIKAALPQQRANYAAWLDSGAVDGAALAAACNSLGLELDLAGGQISYGATGAERGGDGTGRPALCYDLLYVRHGKTTGNTEPRVYQGYVDEPSNALNEIGLGQAEEAADKLDALNLSPDLVILSPLSRASETGKAYLKRHPELDKVTETWELKHEMAFGSWDNVMVKDLPDDAIAHLFYLDQNAVVKAEGPYPGPVPGGRTTPVPIENFVDVLVRMESLLLEVDQRMRPLADAREPGAPPPLVMMYGHSMAGAAIGVLTGTGKQVDGESFLGFDGKYILPNATPVFLHKASP